MRCSSLLRKASTCATSLTWMPAAPMSVSEAGRVAHRQVRGDPAAKRTPDEMDAGEVELIEKIEIEVCEIADGIKPCRRIGGAEAGMLRSDDIELFCQLGHAREPDSQAAAAMEKEQRRPRPAAHETDAAVADRDGRD